MTISNLQCPNSSTVCALLFIHDAILKLLDDSNVGAVRLITFDLSRAFDRVPHHQLLSCVSELELPYCSSFVNWLSSYLCDRQQQVKLGETRSRPVCVTSGVPQGSVLGPVLFSIYMSSYSPHDDNVIVVKYADDVSMILPVFKDRFNDSSIFDTEVSHFESWCKLHQMKINHEKTKVLNFHFSSTPLPSCPNFDNVHALKVLGLIFNEKLSWSSHFEFIVKKTSHRLYILRVLKNLLSHDRLVMVFHATILSLLDYASPVFLNAGSTLDSSFVSLCKRAFRIIHGPHRHCDKCNFLDIYKRRLTLSMKLFNDAMMSESHVLHNLVPSFSVRSKRIVIPSVRTTRRVKGFFFSCSLEHNRNV